MKEIDLIVFGGQSNMQGQSDCLSDTSVVDGAWEFRMLDDAFVPLKNPVGEDIRIDGGRGYCYREGCNASDWRTSHVLGSACYGHTNLVPSFCAAYHATSGADVIAVHAAKGSTVLAKWMPGTDGYAMLVKKAKAAIQKAEADGFTIRHKAIVWLQGESDALVSTSREAYKAMLTDLNNALKRELGIEAFGVIRIGYFGELEKCKVILAAQDEICAEHPDFVMLTTLGTELCGQPKYMNPNVGGHFGAAGLELLGAVSGKRLAETFQK